MLTLGGGKTDSKVERLRWLAFGEQDAREGVEREL